MVVEDSPRLLDYGLVPGGGACDCDKAPHLLHRVEAALITLKASVPEASERCMINEAVAPTNVLVHDTADKGPTR